MSDLPIAPPANTGGIPSAPNQNPNASSSPPTAGGQKEREVLPRVDSVPLEEISGDLELAPELEQAGVQKVSETIELPPDVRKLGVQSTGHAQPVVSSQRLPQVTLPISDGKVVQGSSVSLKLSFRWLAEWCLRKLKKAHLVLVQRNGQVVREREA